MDAGDRPWVVCAEGLIVTVRLTPKAGRDSIDGIMHLSDDRSVLKARVSAAPSGGEANSALARLLAQMLRVAPRDVALVGGTTSRIKRMLIKGDVRAIVAALEQIGKATAK
jgi:uncharacterized protein (TIGR00251 family)